MSHSPLSLHIPAAGHLTAPRGFSVTKSCGCSPSTCCTANVRENFSNVYMRTTALHVMQMFSIGILTFKLFCRSLHHSIFVPVMCKNHYLDWVCSPVVEHMLSMPKAFSSIPSIKKCYWQSSIRQSLGIIRLLLSVFLLLVLDIESRPSALRYIPTQVLLLR